VITALQRVPGPSALSHNSQNNSIFMYQRPSKFSRGTRKAFLYRATEYGSFTVAYYLALADNFATDTDAETQLLQALTLAVRYLVKYHKVEWWIEHTLRYFYCYVLILSSSDLVSLYCKRAFLGK